METMILNEAQFIEVLGNIKGCQFVNLISNTIPSMRKTHNPYYGRIQKISEVNAQFNYDYATAVNNRLEKQGDEKSFESEKPSWWHWENSTTLYRKVQTHNTNGTHYLRLYVLNSATPKVQYLLDGRPMEAEEIEVMKGFLTEKSSSKKQAEAGLVENQVKPFITKFENIVSLTIDNKIIKTNF